MRASPTTECLSVSFNSILVGECSAFLASGSEPTGAGLNILSCAGGLVSVAISATEIPVALLPADFQVFAHRLARLACLPLLTVSKARRCHSRERRVYTCEPNT